MKRLLPVLILIFLGLSSVEATIYCPSKTTAYKNSIVFVGRITDLGNDSLAKVWFEYGETKSKLRKTRYLLKNQTGIYCLQIKNLQPCRNYYYRAAIANKVGNSYGELKEIKTPCY